MFVQIDRKNSLYSEALDLRYELFFKGTKYDRSVLLDDLESCSQHYANVENEQLIAYGRLTEFGGGRFQISQVVVKPFAQNRGYGSKLLLFLLRECEKSGYEEVFLNARLVAINLYERLGFKACGPEYISPKTKIAHVKMVKRRGAV